MNFRPVMPNRRFWSSLGMALIVFLFMGCKLGAKTWIDDMLLDVELADKGRHQETRDAAKIKVAHKYFPIGMRKEDVFALLLEMKNSGFDVREYKYDTWSRTQYPPGIFKVVAIRKWRSRLVVEEFFSMSIIISDDTGLIRFEGVTRTASFI